MSLKRFAWPAAALSVVLVAGHRPAEAASLCPGEAGLRSPSSNNGIPLRVGNATRRPLRIYWINFQGRREFYSEIRPGGEYRADTYTGHPWVVTDSAENCRNLLVSNRGGIDLNVTD